MPAFSGEISDSFKNQERSSGKQLQELVTICTRYCNLQAHDWAMTPKGDQLNTQ